MQLREGLPLVGFVRLDLKKGDQPLWRRTGRNLIVETGRNLYASIIASTMNRPSHFAIGSSAVDTLDNMTSLQGTEHQRVAFGSTGLSGNTVAYDGEFGPGLGSTQLEVAEFGLFNAASGGIMLARFTTSPFFMNQDYTLNVVWTVNVGDV